MLESFENTTNSRLFSSLTARNLCQKSFLTIGTKIILKLKPADESITIIGQASMLRQLFFNIIDNAIIYTPENGKINIALSKNTNQVIIKIIDTGIGIAPEEQKKIFERFYRVDSSRSQIKGYGLGLAICQSIVSIYKGRIDIDSNLGRGTTVTVFLPRF